MNSIRRIRGVATAALLLLASTTVNAGSSAQSWLENYYQQPAPGRFESAVFELSRTGYFDQKGNVPLAIGFLASVFAQHPDRAEAWMSVSRVLPVAHQRILASALWYSNHTKGTAHLRHLARNASTSVRQEIEGLIARGAPDLRAAEVLSPESLNLQWGVFLATGETQAIRNILAALGSSTNDQLAQDVRWSLARNAAQHERVLAICRDELDRQPNAVRETLRAVIADTERRQPAS